MRILIIGAGATGGYFGAHLVQAGRDVTFLVRPRRAAALQREGLSVLSPRGDFKVTPRLLVTGEASETFDVVILAVKAYALDGALIDMAPAVGAGTMIFPLLNGMRHVDLLVRRFGEGAVLGGVCRVATTLDLQGRIVQITDLQELIYGERDGAFSKRVETLDAAMRGAGFDAHPSSMIMQDMWEKWVMLASLAGLTCLMRGSIGEIEAAPGGTSVALRFLAETGLVATAWGHPPREAFAARARSMLTAKGSRLTASMFRDMEMNLPVEVEHILGDMLRRASEHGLATPLLEAATAEMRIYQNRLPASPARVAAPAAS
jgi:2-dehydropantoate 2-reductase